MRLLFVSTQVFHFTAQYADRKGPCIRWRTVASCKQLTFWATVYVSATECEKGHPPNEHESCGSSFQRVVGNLGVMFQFAVEEVEEIDFLDYEDVVEQHNFALEDFPESPKGILNDQHIYAAVERPRNYCYYEKKTNLLELAALLCVAISESHSFQDGNKRTALLCMLRFLELNGIELHPNVNSSEPGRLIEQLYESDSFGVLPILDYLQTRCIWMSED